MHLLGFKVCESTVDKYMVRRRNRKPTQTWRSFLANHLKVSAGCDSFTVPTLTFKVLYAFVVLSHDRRKIVHINVTRHPTAAWTAQQITEAFPGDRPVPRYLHRDRDSVYGDLVRKRIAAMDIQEIVSARKCPWHNPFAELVIGSIRRECTDHIIALGEDNLRRVLQDYVEYYNRSRCHLSLDGNAPEPREVECGSEPVRAIAHLGGLHHRYTRAA